MRFTVSFGFARSERISFARHEAHTRKKVEHARQIVEAQLQVVAPAGGRPEGPFGLAVVAASEGVVIQPATGRGKREGARSTDITPPPRAA